MTWAVDDLMQEIKKAMPSEGDLKQADIDLLTEVIEEKLEWAYRDHEDCIVDTDSDRHTLEATVESLENQIERTGVDIAEIGSALISLCLQLPGSDPDHALRDRADNAAIYQALTQLQEVIR